MAAIRSTQFSQLDYHYIVGNYVCIHLLYALCRNRNKNKYLNKKNLPLNLLQDFSNYDVEMFQNGNINISGFRIINREAKEYSNLKNAIFKMEKINIDNEVI